METKLISRRFLLAILAIAVCSPASAHFVFVKSATHEGGADEAVVFFSEAGHVDGERMPANVGKTKLFVRPAMDGKRVPLSVKEEDRDGWVALFGGLKKSQKNYSLEAHCDYGIYHGSLLRYRAKHIRYRNAKKLAKIATAKEFELDVVPSVNGDQLTFMTLWKGKPTPDVELAVEDANGKMTEVTSDKHGKASISMKNTGLFAVRAHHVVADDKGEFEGEEYEAANYYTTVTIEVLPAVKPKKVAATKNYPELPEAISSFGGVISGDYLYVYSGHTGKAHAHSKHNLSQHFRRISLKNPKAWEELSFEEPLQGLPLVAHGDLVYRIGGLRALNDDVESPDLHSSDSFASFDPKTKAWTSLTNLPEPRSSHDAVVIGDQLFVVGGWKLSGDSDGEWHEHALVADLSKKPITWEKLPVPFQRRALAASSRDGKLYVIGGMNEDHDIERTVSVYDPDAKEWSEGPAMPGEGMNGFGVSAWNLDGMLLVSGTDGRVHSLSSDGSKWDTAAELKTPRFFHQLVPAPQVHHVLAVGGASMRQGHLNNIEVIRLDKPRSTQLSVDRK